MSPLSLEFLRIYLAPSGIAAVARRRFWPGPVRTAAWSNPRAHATDWKEALPALPDTVGELGGGAVELVLSGHFFRYQILPWQDGMQNRDEAQACAKYALTRTYGREAEQWSVVLSDEPPGSARIAAGFDPDLLDRLSAAVSSGGGCLRSVRPGLVAALNAWRREIGADDPIWFVLHESGLLTLVLIERGEWQWIRARRAGTGWCARLADMLAEEALMLGADLPHAAIKVVSPEQALSDQLPTGARVFSFAAEMKRLGLQDGHFEFAWMG